MSTVVIEEGDEIVAVPPARDTYNGTACRVIAGRVECITKFDGDHYKVSRDLPGYKLSLVRKKVRPLQVGDVVDGGDRARIDALPAGSVMWSQRFKESRMKLKNGRWATPDDSMALSSFSSSYRNTVVYIPAGE